MGIIVGARIELESSFCKFDILEGFKKISKNSKSLQIIYSRYIVHQLYARYNAARISEQTLSEVKDWKFRAEDVFVNEMDSKLQDMVWRSVHICMLSYLIQLISSIFREFTCRDHNQI